MNRSKLCTLLAISLSVILFFGLAFTSYAETLHNEIIPQSEFRAEEVYLYSYSANRVLYLKSENDTVAPASSAKMMAGLLVCEKYSHRLDDKITVTDDMLKGAEGTSMGIKSGMSFSIKELLYGTICGTNNDAAILLAISCSGTKADFVSEMNAYAKLLDMRNTVYVNPTGLDAEGSTTCLTDVAKLSARAADNSMYLEISSTASYTTEAGITVYNRNALISQFSAQGYINNSAKGLIAGSTEEGGYVLAAYAEKNGSAFLCVVMKAEADSGNIYSYDTANRLIDYATKGYEWTTVASDTDIMDKRDVSLALTSNNGAYIECILQEDAKFFLPDDIKPSQIKHKIYYHSNELNAPITKGTVVGRVDFYYKDIFLGSTKLVAGDSVEVNSLLLILENMKQFFLSSTFWLAMIIALPIIIAYLITEQKKSRHKRIGTIKYKNFY